PGDNGYLTGKENHVYSFLGMAPKDDPQLMMYVSIKQPELDEEDHESGSVPVSFIFKNVMKSSLKYLNIEPDKDSDASFDPISIPEISGRKTAELKKQLEEKTLDVTVIGEGEKVVKA